jgi:hypothetical protein
VGVFVDDVIKVLRVWMRVAGSRRGEGRWGGWRRA